MNINAQPEFAGQCAFALSTGKHGVNGSPKHQITTDGTTYYFKNGAARFLWKVMPNRANKASTAWVERAANQ